MTNFIKNTFFLLFILVLAACGGSSDPDKKPIAKVGKAYLYDEDLRGLDKGFSAEDSIARRQFFIQRWVEDELLWEVAQAAVAETETVRQQVERYRRSLILQAYYDELVKDELDTNFTNQEIAEYYEQNKSDYGNAEALVRCHFVKIAADAADADRVKGWFEEDSKLYFEQIQAACANKVPALALRESTWLPINNIFQHIPPSLQPRRPEKDFLLSEKEGNFYYLLRIFDYQEAGGSRPLSTAKEEIKTILTFQRKKELLDQKKAQIYTNAQNDKRFELY